MHSIESTPFEQRALNLAFRVPESDWKERVASVLDWLDSEPDTITERECNGMRSTIVRPLAPTQIPLGPSYFMADERSAGGPQRISAHLFLSGDRLDSWPRDYLEEAGPHRNTFETISVSIRGDAAVAITRDTGSNKFRSWSNEEVSWLLGRMDDGWRIVGLIVRDIQLGDRWCSKSCRPP